MAGGPARAVTSDDFSAPDLDTGRWIWVDPLGGSGLQQDMGLLTVQLPGGPDHAPGLAGDTSCRLLQVQPDSALTIEAKFESFPNASHQFQGLIVAGADGADLRWGIQMTPAGLRLFAAIHENGLVRARAEVVAAPVDSLFLKIDREGDRWIVLDSADRGTWTERARFDFPLVVTAAGLVFENAHVDTGSTDRDRHDSGDPGAKAAAVPAPPLTAVVDYFFDSDNPIPFEDGQLHLTGVRTFEDLQALYLFRAGSGATVFDHAPGQPALSLDIADTQSVHWLPGGGLEFHAPTLALSAGPAERVIAGCRASGGLSLEAWLDPLTVDQSGPARILTVSGDPSERNATLAHGLWGELPTTVFDTRLRTTTTSDNGQPDTYTGAGSLTGGLQHVVATFGPDGFARIYVDGVEAAAQQIGGTLDNWDPGFPLALAGEVDGTRNWLGTLRLAAVYSRALTPTEVANNHLAGPDGGELPDLAPAVQLSSLTPGDVFYNDGVIALEARAGDADGTVTRVDFMVGDALLFSDDTAPFAFDWNDPPVGSHLVRAVAYDDDGLTSSTPAVPIVVAVPLGQTGSALVSDDFSGQSLNPYWESEDGTGGAVLEEDWGHYLVDVPAGGDPWNLATGVVSINQPEIDVDLACELKLATVDFRGDAWGGLRLTGDAGEGIQFIGRRTGGYWTVEWGVMTGAGFVGQDFRPVAATDAGLWLQLRRDGSAYTLLYSVDGLIYQTADTLVTGFVPARSAWVSGGLATGGSPRTVAADYMFNLATPIFPEDGGSGGDETPPAIEDLLAEPELDRATLSWTTDEPAFARLSYGMTPGLEMGTLIGGAYREDHVFDITGLADSTAYHFAITCIDTAGNVRLESGRTFHTDIVAGESSGPAPGDVYREAIVYTGLVRDDWRVTDPDAVDPGAAAFLPNPILTIDLPDLTGAVRAELLLDRWGGHPGTSRKRVRFNGASWLHLPEPPIPDALPECFMYQDNPMIELPLDQLQPGSNTLEGTADEQVCNDFGWGQWGLYGALVRIYYEGETEAPSGAILQPADGDTLVEAVDVVVDATAPGGVDEVVILARYEGADVDGDGILNEWHRTYRRDNPATGLHLLGAVGVLDAPPWTANWNLDFVPEQTDGAVALQARIRGADGLWTVAPLATGLSVRHTDGDVRLYVLEDVPRVFWVRTTKVLSATFTIPPEHDLAQAGSTRLIAHTWNGSDHGVIDVNGTWSVTDIGSHHFWQRDEVILPSANLLSGVNTVTISAATLDHGMEVLWPGPMVVVRYDGGAKALDGDGGATENGATPAIPARFELGPNTPNPFNPVTRISYALPAAAHVRLRIFDLRGKLVRTLVDEERPAGYHHADWLGRDDAGRGVSSGTYLYRLDAGEHGDTGKMMLLR